jgi:hypothetical protein
MKEARTSTAEALPGTCCVASVAIALLSAFWTSNQRRHRARWMIVREIHFCFDLVWKICCIVTVTTHNWLVFCMHVDKISIGRILYIFSSCDWNQIAGRILLVADLSYWQRRLAINKTKGLYGICGGQSRFGVRTFSFMYLGFCLLVRTPYPVCVESIFKSTLPLPWYWVYYIVK